RAYCDYELPDVRLYYWRTLAGNEVDFILYGGNKFIAVEVKNTKVTNPADFRGLYSFGDDYPEAKLLLIYRGSIPMKHKNILVIPVEIFLRNMGEYL
ncbi:MAG TPA: DUF4143 domain-containing protein, partial [Bacteroidales bacterium]|nr:DUF4143 domain-containing protein [Bacteroidales bacterium]